MSPQLFLKRGPDEVNPGTAVQVTILHDTRSFLGARVSYEDGTAPKLKRVFECWAPAFLDPITLLEDVFEEFNIGEGVVAREYRANGLRSLSTGDVVVIGDLAFRCDPVGWAKFALPPQT